MGHFESSCFDRKMHAKQSRLDENQYREWLRAGQSRVGFRKPRGVEQQTAGEERLPNVDIQGQGEKNVVSKATQAAVPEGRENGGGACRPKRNR